MYVETAVLVIAVMAFIMAVALFADAIALVNLTRLDSEDERAWYAGTKRLAQSTCALAVAVIATCAWLWML